MQNSYLNKVYTFIYINRLRSIQTQEIGFAYTKTQNSKYGMCIKIVKLRYFVSYYSISKQS